MTASLRWGRWSASPSGRPCSRPWEPLVFGFTLNLGQLLLFTSSLIWCPLRKTVEVKYC